MLTYQPYPPKPCTIANGAPQSVIFTLFRSLLFFINHPINENKIGKQLAQNILVNVEAGRGTSLPSDKSYPPFFKIQT